MKSYDATHIAVSPRVQELQVKLILAAHQLSGDSPRSFNHEQLVDEAGLLDSDCPLLLRTIHELSVHGLIASHSFGAAGITEKGRELAKLYLHIRSAKKKKARVRQ